MDRTIWEKFAAFIRQSITEKFKTFYPGVLVGLIGAKSLLFAGLSNEMVTLGAYILKYIGTVIMAFSSGLATAYAGYLIEQHKEKKNGKTKGPKKGQKGKAA